MIADAVCCSAPMHAFHLAAREGDLAMVQEFLTGDPRLVRKAEDGVTALHLAALKGHATIVELLLVRDAKVNARTGSGDTPLHWAAFGGHVSVVELLVAHGADPSTKNSTNLTPLQEAARKGHDGVVQVLVRYRDVGLHGWLDLVAVGLAVSPLVQAGQIVMLIILYQGGAASWSDFLFSLTVLSILLVAALYANVLLYTRRKVFPGYMIGYLLAILVASLVLVVRSANERTLLGVAVSFFAAIAWVPYFLRSRRVRATFTR